MVSKIGRFRGSAMKDKYKSLEHVAHFALESAKEGKTVIILSNGIPKEEIVKKIIFEDFKEDEGFEKIAEKANLPIYIDDTRFRSYVD